MSGVTAQQFWEQQNDAAVYAANQQFLTQQMEINPIVPTPFNIGVATVQQGQGLGEQQPVGPTS
jgi:hypothetical protein